MRGTPPSSPPISDSSISDEFSKVTAMGPFSGLSWSDLPIDILLGILHRLDLPQALAFASVCKTWRSAAMAAGVPCSSASWLMSWANLLKEREERGRSSSAVTCNFYHLYVNKALVSVFHRAALLHAVEPLMGGWFW